MDLVEVPLPARRGRTSIDLRDATRRPYKPTQQQPLPGSRRRVPNGGILRVAGNDKFFTWHAANNYSRLELSEWSMQCASASNISSQHALDLQFDQGDLSVPGAAKVLMLPTRDRKKKGKSTVVCCCVVTPDSVVHIVRFINPVLAGSIATNTGTVVFAGASRGGRTLPPQVVTSRYELFVGVDTAAAGPDARNSNTNTNANQITCASWGVRSGDGALILSMGRPDGSVACAVFRDPLSGVTESHSTALLQQQITGPKPEVRVLHDKSMVRQFLRRVVSSATGVGGGKQSGEYIAAITCFSPWRYASGRGGDSDCDNGMLVLSLGVDSRLRIWSVDQSACVYRMELVHHHQQHRQQQQPHSNSSNPLQTGEGQASIHSTIESAVVNVRCCRDANSSSNGGKSGCDFLVTIVCQFAAAPPTSFLFSGSSMLDADGGGGGVKFAGEPTRFIEESVAFTTTGSGMPKNNNIANSNSSKNNHSVRSFFGMAICDVAHCGDHVLTLWRDDNSASAAAIVQHPLVNRRKPGGRTVSGAEERGSGGGGGGAMVMVDPQPEEWACGDLRIHDISVEDQVHQYGIRRLGLPGRFVPQAILESAQRSLGCKLNVPTPTPVSMGSSTSRNSSNGRDTTTSPLPDTLENLTNVIAAVEHHIRTCASGGSGDGGRNGSGSGNGGIVNTPAAGLVVAHQLWRILLQDCARVARERTLPVALSIDTTTTPTTTTTAPAMVAGLHVVVRTGALSLLRARLPMEQEVVSSGAAAGGVVSGSSSVAMANYYRAQLVLMPTTQDDDRRAVVVSALATLAAFAFDNNADLLRRALDTAVGGGLHQQGQRGGPCDLYSWVRKRCGQVEASTLQELDRFMQFARARLAVGGDGSVALTEALHSCAHDVLQRLTADADSTSTTTTASRAAAAAVVSPLLCEAVTHALVQVATAGCRVACGLLLVLTLLRHGVLLSSLSSSGNTGGNINKDTAEDEDETGEEEEIEEDDTEKDKETETSYADTLVGCAALSAHADELATVACRLAHAFAFIQHARSKTCSTRRQLFEFPALVLSPISSSSISNNVSGGGGVGGSTNNEHHNNHHNNIASSSSGGAGGGSGGSDGAGAGGSAGATGERERASLVRLLLDRQGGLNDMVSRQRAELVVSTLHVIVTRVLAMQQTTISPSKRCSGRASLSFLERLHLGVAASLECFTSASISRTIVVRPGTATTTSVAPVAGVGSMLVGVLRGAFESELVVSFVHFALGMGMGMGVTGMVVDEHEPSIRTMLLTGAEAQLQLVLESHDCGHSSPHAFAEQVDNILRVLQRCAPPSRQLLQQQEHHYDEQEDHVEASGDVDAGVEYLVSLAKYLDTLGLSRHATRLAFVALSRLDARDKNSNHFNNDNNDNNTTLSNPTSSNLRSVLWANVFAFSTRGADPDYRLALSAIVAQTDSNKREQFLRQLIVGLLDNEQYECILSLPLSRDADLHASALDLIKQRAQYTPPRYALSHRPAVATAASADVAGYAGVIQLVPANCYHLWFAMCMRVGAFVDAAEAMLRLARHHERVHAPPTPAQQQHVQHNGHLLAIARARAEALSAANTALQLVAPHDAVLVLGGGGASGSSGNVPRTMIHAVCLADVQREFVLADALARLTQAGEIPRVWTCTCREDALMVVRQLLDVQLVEVAAGLCASEKLDMEPFVHDDTSTNDGSGNGGSGGGGGGVFVTLTDMCVDSGSEEGIHWDLLRSLLTRFDRTTTTTATSPADDIDVTLVAPTTTATTTASSAPLPTFRYHAVVLERLLTRRANGRSRCDSSSGSSSSGSKPVPLWLLRSFKRWAQFSRRHTPDEHAFAAGQAHPALCAKLMLQCGLIEDACELVAEMMPLAEDVKSWVGVVVEPPWIPTALIDQLIAACNKAEREHYRSSSSSKSERVRVRALSVARLALEERTHMFFKWVVEQQPFRNASYLGNVLA